MIVDDALPRYRTDGTYQASAIRHEPGRVGYVPGAGACKEWYNAFKGV
jgi:hypothetical protein